MSNHPSDENPYALPESDSLSHGEKSAVEKVKWKVMAPAVALMVVGSLGLVMSIVNIVFAITTPPVVVDPAAPEFIKGFQQGRVGPLAVAIQSVFIIVNLIIIIGATQMLRFQSRVFAIVASSAAIMNLGTCCCVIGAPIGIWSLIVLGSQDVNAAFDATVTKTR